MVFYSEFINAGDVLRVCLYFNCFIKKIILCAFYLSCFLFPSFLVLFWVYSRFHFFPLLLEVIYSVHSFNYYPNPVLVRIFNFKKSQSINIFNFSKNMAFRTCNYDRSRFKFTDFFLFHLHCAFEPMQCVFKFWITYFFSSKISIWLFFIALF